MLNAFSGSFEIPEIVNPIKLLHIDDLITVAQGFEILQTNFSNSKNVLK